MGFDCSGLVQWAWGQAGVSIPRTTETQWPALTHVSLDALQPGDLLFYYNLDGDNQVDHVVMYTGSGPYGTDTVIQAPFTGSTVSYSPIFTEGLIGAARPDSPAAGQDPVARGDRYDGPMASGRQVVGEKNRSTAIVPIRIAAEHTDEPEDPRLSDVDEWGRSERTRALARALYEPIYSKWFRDRMGRAREDPDRRRRARSSPTTPAPSPPTRRSSCTGSRRSWGAPSTDWPTTSSAPCRSSGPCGPAPAASPPVPPTPTGC